MNWVAMQLSLAPTHRRRQLRGRTGAQAPSSTPVLVVRAALCGAVRAAPGGVEERPPTAVLQPCAGFSETPSGARHCALDGSAPFRRFKRNAGFNERHKQAFERCGRYLRLASNLVVGHVKLALKLAARDNGVAVLDFYKQTEWESMLVAREPKGLSGRATCSDCPNEAGGLKFASAKEFLT